MKKVILSLMAVAFSGTMLMAQITNSDNSGNKPSASLNGFTFEFNGTLVENCDGSRVPAFAQIAGTNFVVNTTAHALEITTTGAQSPYLSQKLGFSSGNCSPAQIDMSSAANQKFEIAITSDTIIPQLLVYFYDITGAATANYPYIATVPAGSSTLTVTTGLDFSEIDESQVNGIGFVVRKSWNDATISADILIDYILVGDGALAASTTAQVDNSLISVYPNPAKDMINVDLSSLNAAGASVKVMNANGMVVYNAIASNNNETINTSSFNKGIYLVQVSSGNKISNKKIVIE